MPRKKLSAKQKVALRILSWPHFNNNGLSGWQISRSDDESFSLPSPRALNLIFHDVCQGVRKNIKIVRGYESGRYCYIRMPIGLLPKHRQALAEALATEMGLGK